MSKQIKPFFSLRKTAVALAVYCLSLSAAQADVVSGTIYKATDPVNGAGTTVDYWAFTLPSAASVTIDVRASESYTGAFGTPQENFVDLNGDGEYTVADTSFRVYQEYVSTAYELSTLTPGVYGTNGADDMSVPWTPANATTGGWADGTIGSRDSYLSTTLTPGKYIIAFADYQLTANEATVVGFNAGDTIAGATGLNPFTGAIGQDHFDYQLTILATDTGSGQALSFSTVQGQLSDFNNVPVPIPAAVWLFGSAIAGLGVFRKRKAA